VLVFKTFDELSEHLKGGHSCVTLGVFDGVHLGHQSLIRHTVESALANEQLSVVITFREHPLSVLAPPYTPKRLIDNERKIELLRTLGVDVTVMLDFSQQFASTPPEDFVKSYLVEKSNISHVICGYDFTFGCRGAGNFNLLQKLGNTHGFTVKSVDPVLRDNRPVKSTHIRDLLYAGHVAEAATLLTRPHELPGTVGTGMKRGRTIGFPTANLQVPVNYQVPAQGVYLCAARLSSEVKFVAAMVNVGVSPTFGDNPQTVEAHLLNFEGDIVGESLALYFLERLREERKFPNPSALVDQLHTDREQARSLWDTTTIQSLASRIPGPTS